MDWFMSIQQSKVYRLHQILHSQKKCVRLHSSFKYKITTSWKTSKPQEMPCFEHGGNGWELSKKSTSSTDRCSRRLACKGKMDIWMDSWMRQSRRLVLVFLFFLLFIYLFTNFFIYSFSSFVARPQKANGRRTGRQIPICFPQTEIFASSLGADS